MLATVSGTPVRITTSGSEASKSGTVTVPASSRMLVLVEALAGSIVSPFHFSSVTLDAVSGIKIGEVQTFSWKLEAWVIDNPDTAATTVTITPEASAKFAATVIFLTNCRSLLSTANIRFAGTTTTSEGATSTSAFIHHPSPTPDNDTQFLEMSLIASDVNNQTFTPGGALTSVFEEDSVANTNVHQALAKRTIAQYLGSDVLGAPSDDWTLGTADEWAGISVVVTGTSDGAGAVLGGDGCIPQNVTNPTCTAPAAANTIAIAGSSSVWGNSAWGEVDASTSEARVLLGVFCYPGVTSDFDTADMEVDVGVGGAGSETVIATLPVFFSSAHNGITDGNNVAWVGIPADLIPNGSRVSIRYRKNDNWTGNSSFGYLYYKNPITGTLTTTTAVAKCYPSAADSVTTYSAASAWTSGSWYQLVAATGADIVIGAIVVACVTTGVGEWELDIAKGGAGSEVVITTHRGYHQSFASGPCTKALRIALNNVASGTRIAARLRTSVGAGAGLPVKLQYYEITPADDSIFTTKPVKWTTPAANGTTVTEGGGGVGGGAMGSYSAWTEVLASTSAPVAIVAASLAAGGSYTGLSEEFQVGVGGAGAEAVIGSFVIYGSNSGNDSDRYVQFALPMDVVASSQRLSIRARTNGTGGFKFSLGYIENPDFCHRSTVNHTYEPNGQNGITFASSTTNWANTGWQEVIASTTDDGYLTGMTHRTSSSPGLDPEFDIGVGGAGSEAVLETVRPFAMSNSAFLAGSWTRLPAGRFVAAGSRISVRARKAGTTSINYVVAVWLAGVFDTAPPATKAITQLLALVAFDKDADTDVVEVTPCEGDGDPGSGSNPSNGTSIAGKRDLVQRIVVKTKSGTTYRWGKKGIPIGGARTAPKVLSFGRYRRALTDRTGMMETSSGKVTLSDMDRVLRTLYETGELDDAIVDFEISAISVLLAGGTWQRIGRAIVKDFKPLDDLRFELTLADVLLAAGKGVLDQQLQVPTLLIGPDGAAIGDLNPTEVIRDKPVPWAYGAMNDGTGTIEGIYIGAVTFDDAPELGNNHVFLFSYGVLKNIQKVFGADIWTADPPTARVEWPESGLGVWYWVPGKTGWFLPNDWWEDDNGRRYSIVVGKDGHPAVMAAVSGKIPMAIDCCGLETVGDKSGTMIKGIPLILEHFINNNVAQDAIGDWAAIATIPGGGYSLFDTATFVTVNDYLNDLGANAGAAWIGYGPAQQQLLDLVARACLTGGFDVGQGWHGQIIASILDTTDPAESAPRFSDKKSGGILKGTWRQEPNRTKIENYVRYVYARKYLKTLADLTPVEGDRIPRSQPASLSTDQYSNTYLSGLKKTDDATSITSLGGGERGTRRSKVLEMDFTRTQATADSAATRRKDWFKPAGGRADVSFDAAIGKVVPNGDNGTAVELGKVIWVESLHASWTGYKRCRILAIDIDLDHLLATLDARVIDGSGTVGDGAGEGPGGDDGGLLPTVITVDGETLTIDGQPVYYS